MRFAMLPLLALGVLIAGCADQGTMSPDQQAKLTPQLGVPPTDPNAAPTGSHIVGAATDPFSCQVTSYDITKAPQNLTGPSLLTSSNCAPFLSRR